MKEGGVASSGQKHFIVVAPFLRSFVIKWET